MHDWAVDLAGHEFYTWQLIQRIAHWKINAKLENSTFILALMNENHAVPPLGYSEGDIWDWCIAHSRRKIHASR